jgi:hypothetical protein
LIINILNKIIFKNVEKLMRYLAPLNSDIGFKKIFGDPEIAKIFLQDLLNVIKAAKKEKIEALKMLKKAEKVEHQKKLVLIQKMLKKGETVAEIADLLDVTIPQLQKWIHELKK